MTANRYWNVTQGTSRARVRADDYAGAVQRAAYIGFKNPDSIVLAYDLTKPEAAAPAAPRVANPLKPVQNNVECLQGALL